MTIDMIRVARVLIVFQVVALILATSAEARRTRRKVPLMPVRPDVVYVEETVPEVAPEPQVEPETPRAARKGAKMAIVVEAGALGFKDDVDPDFAGAQMLPGVRVGGYWPVIGSSIFLKPTVGYFGRIIVNDSFQITQHDVEAGVTLEYARIRYHGLQFAIGVAQRVDFLFKNESTISTTGSVSGFNLRYRVGPTVSIGTMVSRDLSVLLNFEGGMVIKDPMVPYAGATVGLQFHLY